MVSGTPTAGSFETEAYPVTFKISNNIFYSFEFSIWFFFTVSISLMRPPIFFFIINMFSFTAKSIAIIPALKSLSGHLCVSLC